MIHPVEANMFAWFEMFTAIRGRRCETRGTHVWFRAGVGSPLFNGVYRARPGSAGMARGLADLGDEQPPDGVRVERVSDRAGMERWARALCEGYEVPAWAGEHVRGAAEFGEDRMPYAYYLATLDGDPVGTSIMVPGGGVAGIYGQATVPRAKRRGVGTGLMRRAMLDARDRFGLSECVLASTDEGYPFYRALPTSLRRNRWRRGVPGRASSRPGTRSGSRSERPPRPSRCLAG